MRPSAAILEQLATLRLLPSHAVPSMGIGERRSASRGAGIEFAEHRPYRRGDDVRHIDPRVKARLGEDFIRQYFVDRQLPVYVLLDASQSMRAGSPSKFEVAALIAQLIGFVGLAAGDRVQVGTAAGGRFRWSDPLHGVARADRLFAAVGGVSPGGRMAFGDAIEQAVNGMGKRAQVVVIGDFWDDGVPAALRQLQLHGHEVIAIQVVDPEELDPRSIGAGTLTMIDDETGEEIELAVDENTLRQYQDELARHVDALRQRLVAGGGRFFQVAATDDIERFVTRDLRAAGVLS